MALFSEGALKPGVRRREVFGCAMYDFANSGNTTVVITAVFAPYFVGGIAQKAERATFAWTLARSISYAIVMPTIGAYADLRAAKRRIQAVVTVGCVLGTAALALPQPGAVALAMLLIVVSNVFREPQSQPNPMLSFDALDCGHAPGQAIVKGFSRSVMAGRRPSRPRPRRPPRRRRARAANPASRPGRPA